MELELETVGGVGQVRLLDDHDVVEAVGGDADGLVVLDHQALVLEVDVGGETLQIRVGSRLRVGLHGYSGLGVRLTGDPGVGGTEELVGVGVELLGILTEGPDVAVVVLGEEGELRFLQCVVAEVPVPHDHGPDPVDHLGEVGDGELHPVGPLGCGALQDELRPGLEGQVPVVDVGRAVEIVGVELVVGDKRVSGGRQRQHGEHNGSCDARVETRHL